MPRGKKPYPGATTPGVDQRGPSQPVTTPTGMGYGKAGALADAQRSIPLPNDGAAPDARMAAVQNFTPPDLQFGRPTDRPGESPLTGMNAPQPAMPTGPNPDVMALIPHLPMLERLAASPKASATTRAFVRRVRSMVPPDFDFNA